MSFEINDRIQEIITHIGVTPYEFSKKMGVKRPDGLYKILDKKSKPSPKTLEKIRSAYPQINYTWLLTGEGEMLKGETSTQKEESKPDRSLTTTKGVPYYDIDFTLSFAEVENSQQVVPDSYVTHPFFTGCDYVIRASGQSMAKIIKHGDAIGLIEIPNWQDFIPMGEVYAIVTHNGFRMIKIITKGPDDDHFTLISKPMEGQEDEFPPQTIHKSNILKIFKVQASSHLF